MKKYIFNSSIRNTFCRLLLLVTVMPATMTDAFAQTTWSGAVNTDWNNAGNWSAGLPNASQDVVIPNVSNDPVILMGTNAIARTVVVQTSASLIIQVPASLTFLLQTVWYVPCLGDPH